jgi:hypothetical protein
VPHRDTVEVIERFNRAIIDHDATLLAGLVGEDCVMEAIQPAPEGQRVEGGAACLAFWHALADNRTTQFEVERVDVAGERATIRWTYRYGSGPSDYVRGVNLMHVVDGLIVEALGYSKTPADATVPRASE